MIGIVMFLEINSCIKLNIFFLCLIVDVNDFPPAFVEPWTPQRPFLSISVPEEQPKGTIVHTFRATDNDSNIDRFRIINPSQNKRPYEIDADTGIMQSYKEIRHYLVIKSSKYIKMQQRWL